MKNVNYLVFSLYLVSVAFAGSQIKNQVKIDLVTDEETLNCIKSEGGLFVMNHRSQVEFVALFLLSKYLGVFTVSYNLAGD